MNTVLGAERAGNVNISKPYWFRSTNLAYNLSCRSSAALQDKAAGGVADAQARTAA